jgi:anti-anti-sigma regulatory factor
VSIRKEQSGDCLQIHLSGAVDERLDWELELGPLSTNRININCKEVTRINAVGVRSWILYFQGLRRKGVEFSFIQCSTAVIEQMNLISNFSCGGIVESLAIPFICSDCHEALVAWMIPPQSGRFPRRIPDSQCPFCKGRAVFDDNAEEYFRFLGRARQSLTSPSLVFPRIIDKASGT